MRKLLVLAILAIAPAAHADQVTVPVDLGIGPAGFLFVPGPVYGDQKLHYGLKLSLQAIISQELIRRERNRIPAQYRQMAMQQKEVRLTPFPLTLIPEDIFISPKLDHTGIYGATIKPVSIGAALGGGAVRLGLDLGVVVTAAYLYSDVLPNTFFARPGVSGTLELELMPTDVFGISLGWESAVYIPQVLGTFLQVTPTNQAIWHIGNGFVKLHFRFPYSTNL